MSRYGESLAKDRRRSTGSAAALHGGVAAILVAVKRAIKARRKETMPADDRPEVKGETGDKGRVVKGPWEQPRPKALRVPVFKRSGSSRSPVINNWGGLVAVILLIFVAAPLLGWISRLIIGLLHRGL